MPASTARATAGSTNSNDHADGQGRAITHSAVPPEIYLVPAEPDTNEEIQRPSATLVARLREHPQVVPYRDRYALSIASTTPWQAMIEDLLFVRRVLDAAGISYLLVRGNDQRPVIAVDWSNRRALRTALVSACRDEPFYSKTVDAKKTKALLVGDGALSTTSQARIFRLFRPRVHVGSGLSYGAATGVQIELWSFTDDSIVLPVENSLTRRSVRRDEVIRGSVERFGLSWPTIETMFEEHASDVAFDIDMVFSWVDGSDLEWRRSRSSHMEWFVAGEGDDHEARFRHVDELRYALRGVYMYAPWIRRIFIATDSKRPEWLAADPRVTFVRSAEFFTDPSVLPTFNSQAVEAQLHHIPDLAEHFLYSNDDMFFGRSVGPEMFFSPGGISMFVEDETRIGLGRNDDQRSGFENAARVNRRLLLQRFGRITTRHLAHAPTPLRRSVLRKLELEFPEEFAATAASPFRASGNVSVTNSLYHYYALLAGHAVVQRTARVRYIDTTVKAGLADMNKMLVKRSTDMFCLNDGSFPEIEADVRASAVTRFLDAYFPIPAPWERDQN